MEHKDSAKVNKRVQLNNIIDRPIETTTTVADQGNTVEESHEDPVKVITTSQISKPRVRNPLGGKNPQIPTKRRGVTKPGKGITRRDRSVANKSSSKEKKDKKLEPDKILILDKENIPLSSVQNMFAEKKHPDEEYIMEYMKTMYKTHGENLLNKFRSGGPIRMALGQVDENDKVRAELLKKDATVDNNKMIIEIDSDLIGMSNRTVQGECATLEVAEEINPHLLHSSQ